MKKEKVLLLSDDIRIISGVAVVSKQLVLNTVNEFDWVQLAAQQSPTDAGSVIDVSDSVKSLTSVEDAYVRLYSNDGYGNPDLLRNIISTERPDVILHFADPRVWQWLYDMEHELRQNIPICYYHVWDNTPTPHFNKSKYLSCDWIACISKLTERCVNETIVNTNKPPKVTYVPHGVDTDVFKPIEQKEINEHTSKVLGNSYEFVVLCNNVNMPRKQLPMLIESYKLFCDTLEKPQRNKVTLLLHTNPTHTTGTNLYEVANAICPEYSVIFSCEKLSDEWLNRVYNIADVTINISCAEGFGLSTLESLSAGTPIIATNTGGLSEQLGDDPGWGISVQPTIRNLVGSKSVPYIYNDICKPQDVAAALKSMYDLSNDARTTLGENGRTFVLKNGYTSHDMCQGIREGLKNTIEDFIPRQRFTCTKLTS